MLLRIFLSCLALLLAATGSSRADSIPNAPGYVVPPVSGQANAAAANTPAIPLPPVKPSPPVVQENGKPIWGVYLGNDVDGSALRAYEKWLGQPAGGILGYTGDANWKDYDGCVGWAMGIWAPDNRRVLWSVAFIPKGASLVEAAKGAYNGHWRKMAQQLATWRPGDPVIYIRTGWEFNGDWFQYSSIKDPRDFVMAWRQFVSTFRSVSDRFRFDWCPSGETGHVEEAYPGDDYVDIIGLDLYDQYRWCKIKDPVERWDKVVMHGDHGLVWHQTFARTHHKPMSYPEWGACGNDAGDDPYFVEQMHKWFVENHVIYASYWDSDSVYQGRLSNNQYPLAAARYRELFGAPAETNPPVAASTTRGH